MGYSWKREVPFTKKVTVSKFSVSKNGVAEITLQQDTLNAITKLGNNSIHVDNDVYIKCRKFFQKNGKLMLFISWYDLQLDVSTTNQNATDIITSAPVNNADVCHLFLSIKDNTIWAFATIAPLNISGRLSKTLWNVLNDRNLDVYQEPDTDMVRIIRDEGIKYIGIEGNYDLLALGFEKTKLYNAFEEEDNGSNNSHFGTLMIDKKNNLKVIQKIEDNPAEAISYMNDEEFPEDKSMYIQTSKRKIDGSKLKKRCILFMTPIGKTKTISWTDACDAFSDIND